MNLLYPPGDEPSFHLHFIWLITSPYKLILIHFILILFFIYYLELICKVREGRDTTIIMPSGNVFLFTLGGVSSFPRSFLFSSFIVTTVR